MKWRHPFLSGQISDSPLIDEIDVSRFVQLNTTFFTAQPTQRNSFQEVMVDGSTISITNHLLNGEISIPVVRGSGLLRDGDFVAALQFIIASKDDIGGTFTVRQAIGGSTIITVFYGVTCASVPHLIIAGNAVVPYNITLNYAGWVQGVSEAALTEKTLWAVGSEYGLKAQFKPYAIQQAENAVDFYGGQPLDGTATSTGVGGNYSDSPEGDMAGVVPTAEPPGGWPSTVIPAESGTNPTWNT